MSDMQQNDVNYEELQQKLASANASAEAAEVHGVICGVITSDRSLPEDWFAELFDQAEAGDLLVEDAKSGVRMLFAETLGQIEAAGLGMQLLLPTDEAALPVRAQAVAEWCQGFLYGVGLSGEQANGLLSGEAQEALEDILTFTRLDVAALGEPDNLEEEEDALMEITEFLWVAAMLIRESFLGSNKKAVPGSSENGMDHEYH